jgi:uncharacterized protein (TIGR00251 family)
VSWHRAEVGRIVLELHVQPGAARTQVAGLHGERLKIRLAARAVDGRANEELVRFLAETLGVARRDVTIEAGVRSRRKRVAVSGAAVDAAALLASA